MCYAQKMHTLKADENVALRRFGGAVFAKQTLFYFKLELPTITRYYNLKERQKETGVKAND